MNMLSKAKNTVGQKVNGFIARCDDNLILRWLKSLSNDAVIIYKTAAVFDSGLDAVPLAEWR